MAMDQKQMMKSIKQLKDGKSVLPDEMHADILKLLNDSEITVLIKGFNNIYETR